MIRRAVLAAAAVAVAGCAVLSSPTRTGPQPRFVEPDMPFPDSGVAVVLSGGAARGFAHVGVIKALEAQGLRPDIVVGSSAGSVVGALYAAGLSAQQLESAARELDMDVLGEWILPGFGFLHGEIGLARASNLQAFVDRWTREVPIEDFPIRFAAVATDLESGTIAVFNAGNAGLAVLASCAVPGLVAPVRIRGRLHGDGQIASPLPVATARALGARIVIAVDVVYPPEHAEITTLIDVLFQSGIVAAHRLKSLEAGSADLVLSPRIPRKRAQLGFDERDDLIAIGEAEALHSMPAIRRAFELGGSGVTRAAR